MQKNPGCNVVICKINTNLLDTKKILSFIYKPANDYILLPLMHEISDNNIYCYDVMCYVNNIKIDDTSKIEYFMNNFNKKSKECDNDIINTTNNDEFCIINRKKYNSWKEVVYFNPIGFIYKNNELYVKLDGKNKINTNFIFKFL